MSIKIDVENLKLSKGYVLVSPVEIEQGNGLVNADQYEDKNEFGRVVLSSKTYKVIKKWLFFTKKELITIIAKDSIVLFGKYSTVNLTINGDDYLLVREEDIIASIEK